MSHAGGGDVDLELKKNDRYLLFFYFLIYLNLFVNNEAIVNFVGNCRL